MKRKIQLGMRVAELVTDNPARAAVMDRLGIDYCCGGRQSLSEACASRGLDLETVLRELHGVDSHPNPTLQTAWSSKPIVKLIDHVIECHHTYLREVLPEISELLSRVARKHAARHPEMRRVREIFEPFRMDLEQHMDREELELFPALRDLDVAELIHDPWPADILGLAETLRDEHAVGEEALVRIQELARNFAPPDDVGDNYRRLLESLEALRADIHLHVHEENNILYATGLSLARAE